MFEDGVITVTRFGGGASGVALAKVTSVSIVNDQLVVNGTNLNGVTGVRITGPSSFDESFSIESKSAGNLIANGLNNVAFAMNGLFNLILTDAQGAATFQVTFTLQDGAVTASKLADMGAGVGQVLKFDGTNWGPSDLGALTYAGTWDSSTATAPNVAPSAGEYYIVTVADTAIDIGDGSGARNFAVGDWLVYNDVTSMWDKIDNATNVTSFEGRSGPVTAQAGDYTWAQIDKTSSVLSQIADVDAPAGDGSDTGKVLKWNNATSRWELGDDLSGGGAGSVTSTEISDGAIVDADVNVAAAIAQSKIANLTTDLASKVPLAGGTMTGDLTVPNLVTAGNVDGVDVSTLATSVGTNTTNIGNNATAIGALDTDDVSEGSALYFTDARARSAAVVNSTAGTETDQAASVASMKSYVTTAISGFGGGDFLADGSVTMTGNLDLGNNKVLLGSDNANNVELIAPNTLGATYTLTMPADDGANGQILSTNGSGVLSWTTASSGTVTNVTGTAPIVSSGGATPAISMAQANGATDGFLDSADWTTFNNKQNALPTGGTTAQYLRGDLTLATLQSDVRSTLLTGFASGAGTVAATDTILQAFNKLNGNIAANASSIAGLDTDDVSEGSALYFTDARARNAAVVNSTAGTETDQAASVAAMKTYVTANAGDIIDGGNTNAATVTIGTNDANSLALETNNSTAMTILSGGNVGIGTTSPNNILDIENDNAEVRLKNQSASGNALISFGVGVATTSERGGIGYFNGESIMRFVTGSNIDTTTNYTTETSMVITQTGNVGIGTTSPDTLLHTKGTTAIKFDRVGAVESHLLLRTANGTIGSETASLDGNELGRLSFSGHDGTSFGDDALTGLQVLASQDWTPTAKGSGLRFYTTPDDSVTSVARLEISEDGNVGIGTTSPRSGLDVQSGAIVGKPATLNGTSTIDFATGNQQYTASDCGAFALHNIKDGGNYAFVVQGTGASTCSFTAFSDAGTTALTVHMPPDHTAITTGFHTIYNFMIMGTHLYVAWTPGY